MPDRSFRTSWLIVGLICSMTVISCGPTAPTGPTRLDTTIGFRTSSGRLVTMIEPGTELPKFHSVILSTSEVDQAKLDIQVVAGSSDAPDDDRTLARCLVTRIPEAPVGEPQVQLMLDVDASGQFELSAELLSDMAGAALEVTHFPGAGRVVVPTTTR